MYAEAAEIYNEILGKNVHTIMGMKAGEAATMLGVGIQTLHFYESEGLIPTPPRSTAGYRQYTPDIIERVRFIRKAQAIGFSLGEIKKIIVLADTGKSPCGRVQQALAEKLSDVDRRLAELTEFRKDLVTLIDRANEPSTHETAAQVCSIVEEAAPLHENPTRTSSRFKGGKTEICGVRRG